MIIDELERLDRLSEGSGLAAIVAEDDGREWLWDNRKAIIRMLRGDSDLVDALRKSNSLVKDYSVYLPFDRTKEVLKMGESALHEYQTAKESI